MNERKEEKEGRERGKEGGRKEGRKGAAASVNSDRPHNLRDKFYIPTTEDFKEDTIQEVMEW